jgi:hypothetical protein
VCSSDLFDDGRGVDQATVQGLFKESGLEWLADSVVSIPEGAEVLDHAKALQGDNFTVVFMDKHYGAVQTKISEHGIAPNSRFVAVPNDIQMEIPPSHLIAQMLVSEAEESKLVGVGEANQYKNPDLRIALTTWAKLINLPLKIFQAILGARMSLQAAGTSA